MAQNVNRRPKLIFIYFQPKT